MEHILKVQYSIQLKINIGALSLQGISNGTYTLPSGVTIPAPLVPSTKTNKITSDLGDFLNSQGRKCHTVNGDGNCMFRAIAHQAFGLEDRHVELRSALHGIIHANTELYRCLWIGNRAFAEHVDNIKLGGVWGTQVELQATSDFFGVPVFVAVLNTRGTYCWHVFKPRTIKFPKTDNQLSLPIYPYTTKHFEVAQNSSRNHYDSIIQLFPGDHHLQPPYIHSSEVTTTIEID